MRGKQTIYACRQVRDGGGVKKKFWGLWVDNHRVDVLLITFFGGECGKRVFFPVYICKRCLSLQWRLWMLVVGVEWCKKLVPRALGEEESAAAVNL